MVTSTIWPRFVSGRRSYMRCEPEPIVKAPPWIHTSTGGDCRSRRGRRDVQVEAVLARRADVHAVEEVERERRLRRGGSRSRRRRARRPTAGRGLRRAEAEGPTGGAAKGMPRKRSRPSSFTPARRPAVVSAVTMVDTSARSGNACRAPGRPGCSARGVSRHSGTARVALFCFRVNPGLAATRAMVT